MSRSRQRALRAQIETVYRQRGGAVARLYADEMLVRGVGVQCPACDGKGREPMPPEELEARKRRGKNAFICELCQGKGALRSRPHNTRERNEDFAIMHGNRP